jgi:hypothetical protein
MDGKRVKAAKIEHLIPARRGLRSSNGENKMRYLLTTLCLVLIFCLSATAATITVTNTNDSGAGSLRKAIADAASSDMINFGITGTITLTSDQLVIDKGLTIQGPGANLLSISGNNASRVFFINGGVTATLDGMTIRDGTGDGGGIYNLGALTVTTAPFRETEGPPKAATAAALQTAAR